MVATAVDSEDWNIEMAEICNPLHANSHVPSPLKTSQQEHGFLWRMVAVLTCLVVLLMCMIVATLAEPAVSTTSSTPPVTVIAPESSSNSPQDLLHRAKQQIVGRWKGRNESMWATLNVEVEFTQDGIVHSKCGDGRSCNTAFYYGTDATPATRHYQLNDVRADGAARGWIEVGWDYDGTTRGTLNAVQFLRN